MELFNGRTRWGQLDVKLMADGGRLWDKQHIKLRTDSGRFWDKQHREIFMLMWALCFLTRKSLKKPKERGGGGTGSAQQFLMTVDTWALWYTLFKKVLGLFSKLPLVPQKFQTTSQFQSTPNVPFYNLKVYPNFTLAFTFFFKLRSIFFVISRPIS